MLLLLLLLLLLLSLGGSQSQNGGFIMEVSPSETTVQEGLCISISCTFQYPRSWPNFGSISGYWFKRRFTYYYEDVLVATSNKGKAVEKDAEGRFHLVGDITKNNCTLNITDVQKKDSGQYYFRIEKWNDGFSYLDHKVNLNVTEVQNLPPAYYVQMPAAVTVQEGLCITILCTFHHRPTSSSPAHGYWFKEGSNTDVAQPVATNDPSRVVQEEFRGRFHLVGDPLENNCTLRITDARKEDSGKYFFRIERGEQKFNYLNYHLDLEVTDLTEKPVIYSPEPLEEGQLATLVCLAPWVCREGTLPTFSWTGAAVPSLQPSPNFSYFSELSFMPKLQDHGSNVTCGMTFPGAGGRALTERTVQLNVTCKTDPLTVYIGAFFACKIMVFLTLCLILTCVKFLRKKKPAENREFRTGRR